MITGAGACRRHRPVLVDLVDRGERGPATPAALDHLAGCRPCEREITELALTVAALRRAGAAYRRLPVAEGSPSVAPVVVATVSTTRRDRRPARGWAFHLGGLIASAGLAALLVAPRIGQEPARTFSETAPARPAAVVTWQQVESRLASSPDIPPVAVVTLPPRYPEGRTRPWKEVPSSDATAHELEPS